jgi:hypothetical protein
MLHFIIYRSVDIFRQITADKISGLYIRNGVNA